MFIGLTGTIGAGKGVSAEFFKSKGFIYLSLSNELRELAKENKIEITRVNLQNLGNKFRIEKGADFLAEIVKDKIHNQQYSKAVIDGIRNPAEINALKKLKSFFLISIDAPVEKRFERIILRNRESDPKTLDEFIKIDKIDQGEGEEKSGQQVKKCMELADFHLLNSGTLEETKEEIEKIYEKIECGIPRLTWDEYFMEILKNVAKRATCNRGRSGAIIVKNKQILATGYVGSPKGLPHCDEVGHQIKEIINEDNTISKHCVRTAHAEQNAICQAAKLGIAIDGSTLYCKMTPCETCAKMIVNVGIKRVVCENKYHKGAENLLKEAGIVVDILNNEIENYKNQ